METFNKIWAMIMPYFTTTTITAIITAIATGLIKGGMNKMFSDVNMAKLFEKSFNKVAEHLQTVTLKQDIQPLVNSKLQEIEEKFNADSRREVAELREAMKQQLDLLHAFMGYFDNSVGISEEKKAEANEIYASAKDLLDKKPLEAQTSVVVVEKPAKEEVKTIKVER